MRSFVWPAGHGNYAHPMPYVHRRPYATAARPLCKVLVFTRVSCWDMAGIRDRGFTALSSRFCVPRALPVFVYPDHARPSEGGSCAELRQRCKSGLSGADGAGGRPLERLRGNTGFDGYGRRLAAAVAYLLANIVQAVYVERSVYALLILCTALIAL